MLERVCEKLSDVIVNHHDDDDDDDVYVFVDLKVQAQVFSFVVLFLLFLLCKTANFYPTLLFRLKFYEIVQEQTVPNLVSLLLHCVCIVVLLLVFQR